MTAAASHVDDLQATDEIRTLTECDLATAL
jgi:hypothetical protein